MLDNKKNIDPLEVYEQKLKELTEYGAKKVEGIRTEPMTGERVSFTLVIQPLQSHITVF